MKDGAAPSAAMHDVLDSDAVEAVHVAFLDSLREKPGFRVAVEKINSFADRPPVLRDTRPMIAPPAIDVSPTLLPKDVPIEALGRALTASTADERRNALMWAYTIDPSISANVQTLATLEDAFRKKHEKLTDDHALERDEIRHALADVAEGAPAVVGALGARVREPDGSIRASITSPMSRATALEEQFGLRFGDPFVDHAPFLALADAAEVVWVQSGGQVGAEMSAKHLKSIVNDVQEAFPEVVARAVLEVDRVARVRQIERRRQVAAERAAQGIAPERSKAVILAPEVAPPQPEEEVLIPEEFVKTPEAPRGRRTTIRRDRGEVDALLASAKKAEPSARDVGATTVVSRKSPAKGSVPVALFAVPVLLIAGLVAIWWSRQSPVAAEQEAKDAALSAATARTTAAPTSAVTATTVASDNVVATPATAQPGPTSTAVASAPSSPEPERSATAEPPPISTAALPPLQQPPLIHPPAVIPPVPTPPPVQIAPRTSGAGTFKGND